MTRALELDPNLAEAHTALGLVRFYFEWDWAGAEAEFRRALDLNPGSRSVHEEYGGFLTAMGRLDEGLAQSREAARLDPLSVSPVHDIALNALIRGDYEQAAAGFRQTIDIDPNWTWGYIKLARTLAIQKKCPEALAAGRDRRETNRGRRGPAVAVVAWSHLRNLWRDRACSAEARRAPCSGKETVRRSDDLRRDPQRPRRYGRGAALV